MQNKKIQQILSLLSIPLLAGGLLFIGSRALATDVDQPVIITLKSDKILSKKTFVYSHPEQAATRKAQQEVKSTLDSASQASARSFSHLPVLAASINKAEAEELEANPLVESVVLEEIFTTTLNSSNGVIDTPEAYTLGFDGSGTAVAVIDTGVDNDHSFLNVISEACFSNAGGFGSGTTLCPGNATNSTAADSADTDQCSAASGCDHGTHVAGIAAGNGSGVGYTGVAKGAGIIAIQVFTQFNTGCAPNPTPCIGAYTSDIIAGLNRVLSLHNDVSFTTPIASVNMSLGGSLHASQSGCDSNNTATKSAIDNLRAVGIASIIASGNEYSSTSITAPGCISSAVAVGATSDSDTIASFSNSHAMLDLLAPGVSILSSVIGDGNFANKSGTSMATPQVAGAWAVVKEKDPNASVDDVLEAFEETGKTINDGRNGLSFSRIDLDDTLSHSNFNVFKINASDRKTSEAGDTAELQFSLSTEPTNDVTIPLSISDVSEGTLSGVTEVVITNATWNDPSANAIIVTGVDDLTRDGLVEYDVITGDPSSLDGGFDSLTANDVDDITLENIDDESTVANDFNGDTQSDVFTANGSVWKVSHSGNTKWQELASSSKKLSKLRFGDFNCDETADVFTANGSQWMVSHGGATSWIDLSSSNAKLSDLIILDVDGDACSDVVRMNGSKWEVSYGGSNPWVKVATSAKTADKMLFGDFDGDDQVDGLAKFSGGQWRISYGLDSPWTDVSLPNVPKNELLVGQFIGSSNDDVLWANGSKWRVSNSADNGWTTIATSGLSTDKIAATDLNGNGISDIFRTKSDSWEAAYDALGPWIQISSSSTPFSKLSL